MTKLNDLTGKKINMLTVIRRFESKPKRNGTHWFCICDCILEDFTRDVMSLDALRELSEEETLKLIREKGFCNPRGADIYNSNPNGCKPKQSSCGCQHNKPPPNKIDHTGEVYGRLTVIGEAPPVPRNGASYQRTAVYAKCECGSDIKSYKLEDLQKKGGTRSCGCLRRERIKETHKTHGMSSSSEYKAYHSMLQRCQNPKNNFYKDYGGRGINICERWLNSFDMFLQDMGSKPTEQHSINRIDNNKCYSPDNCEWASKKE